ncbi:MAG TPA: Hsp70 family protein [Polyangiaceae bacterium]|nr:Hsp70 family protein [Polyangiaceae bacterium]
MALLGIDFGTATIKAVKVPPDGRPKPHDVVRLSAIASFADGKIAVGGPVLMMAGVVDDVVVPGLKRMLGRKPDDPLVRRACERGGFAARALGDLDLEIHLADADPKDFGMSVFAACADLLRDACEAATGQRTGHEAVIAVPSWFTERERQAFLAVAQQAQLRVRRFIRDTVAAAYWTAHDREISGRLAAIDVGAGGVSASVVRITGDRIVHEASFGAAEDGGDDIDAELARTAFDGSDRVARELVRQACEGLKRELSENDQARRKVDIRGGKSVEVALERWEMELLVSPLVTRVSTLTERLVSETRLDTARLGAVLALGGSSALGAIESKIRSHLDEPIDGVDRLKSPALGAALRLAAEQKKGRARELQDGEEDVPEPVRIAPPPGSTASGPTRPNRSRLVRSQVTTRRKEVARHRPAVTRRRVKPGLDAERAPDARAESEAPDTGTAATEAAKFDPATSEPPPSSRSEDVQKKIADTAPSSPRSNGAESERVDEPPEAPNSAAPTTAPSPGTAPPTSSDPGETEDASERSDDASSGAKADTDSNRGDDEDDEATKDADAAPRGPIAVAPHDRTDEPKPARPAHPTGGTKYPARDGQRKYPAVDRSHRRRDAAPKPSKPETDRPRRHPTPVPRSDPDTRKRAMAAALRRHTAIGMSAATPNGGAVIRIASASVEEGPRRRMTIPSASMPREGTVKAPGSAVDLMGLAVARPMLPGDLEPIDAIVLLRRLLGRRSVSGTFELEQGGTVLEVPVQGGRAALDLGEHNALMRALEQGGGRWRLSDEVGEIGHRELHPLPRLALDLLRKRLRAYDADELEAGLGGRVELAPALRSDKDTLPRKLGLGPRELRFVETMLDGKGSARSICRFGRLGTSTSLQVLILLELFECLTWQEPQSPTSEKTEEDAPAPQE